MHKRNIGRAGLIGASSILLALFMFIASSNDLAYGAGSGYGASAAPPPSAAAGGFINVVTTRTFTSTGGVLRGKANGASFIVTVSKGSLSHGGQVVVTTGTPRSINVGKGWRVVADFSVVVLDSSTGQKLSGPFGPALRISIRAAAIGRGDSVFVVTRPGEATRDGTAQISKSLVLASFTRDPNYAVAQRG